MIYQDYIDISEYISEKLNKYLEMFCIKNPVFTNQLTDYSKKRIHLNGIQFYAGFNVINTNLKFEDVMSIPIAIECIMLMAYKTNRILDHKQEVWDNEEKIKETVLDEIIFLKLIFELLETSKDILGEKYYIILDLFMKMISDVNEGFWYEKYFLNLNTSPLKNILENWDMKYKRRNILFNQIYEYAPLIGYYIASNEKNIFQKYEYYIKDQYRFSHAGQMINDLSDYSSVFDENVKSYQDAFSDIRNGIITLPTFLLIKENLILDALNNPEYTKDIGWRKKIIQLLIEKNIPNKIKEQTKNSYLSNIKFWKEIMNIDDNLLFFTYQLLLKNKYFNKFKTINKA